MANAEAGWPELGADPPDGFTWHHHEDMTTMQLIPTDLHGAVRHTGGIAIINLLN